MIAWIDKLTIIDAERKTNIMVFLFETGIFDFYEYFERYQSRIPFYSKNEFY